MDDEKVDVIVTTTVVDTGDVVIGKFADVAPWEIVTKEGVVAAAFELES